jgi:ubiquinone biosynthesis protein COQ4
MANGAIMKSRPLRPLVAWRAMQDLFADPEETSHVFRIIRALSTSRRFTNLFHRVLAEPDGRRLLEQNRSLLETLSDRDRLRALPDGTLGREYVRFMDAEKITADGLEEASQSDENIFYDRRAECLGLRLRDMHDLWHVTTGYGRDFVGEDALLAFTYAQTRNWGIGFIALLAYLRFRREGFRHPLPVIREGYRRGRAARLLPAADWEALLERPLSEVRETLGVGEPPVYVPVTAEDVDQALAATA